jgi:mono/diheme cytochrome c family protein
MAARPMPLRFLILTGATLLAAAANAGAATNDAPVAGKTTFTRDIAPLVFEHCAVCHRPGEVAPFALLNYADVRKHAKEIVELTSTRQMPPWKPVAEVGTFLGERRLNPDEIALLAKWLKDGAIEGSAGDLPATPQFVAGWQMGEPDLIVTMPKAYEVVAEGRDIYRNFVIPMEIPAGKYIRAIEYRPGNRKDGAAGFLSVGFGGSLLPGSAGFWVPGKLSQPLPEGISFPWPKGADLILQLHLHPSGKAETEQSRIGFYFTTDPPRRSLNAIMMVADKIHIPAGEKEYRTHVEKTINSDSTLVGIFPHMHLIGKESTITAILPNGERLPLLHIDQWDFNWQGYYEYAKPISLPRGTVIAMDNVHDNSADNPANPNHPPRPVNGGEQTTNEMSAVVLHVVSNAVPSSGRSASLMASGPTTRPAGPSELEEAAKLVKLYDLDGDGMLGADELAKIPGANPRDIPAVLQRFDHDHDGKLSVAELAEAIATLRQN